MSESQEQQIVVNWFKVTYPDYIIFSVPNGGTRNKIEATNMKREGLLKGVPDLCILLDNNCFFVEMKKRKSGRLSDAQKNIIERINRLGHDVLVCYGADDAIEKIKEYINEKTSTNKASQ